MERSSRSGPTTELGSVPTLTAVLRVALVLGVLVAAGLVATQLLLPRIAARRLAEDLRRSGDVDHVRVRAMPALKLLFNRADSVEIRMSEARAGTGRIADLLDEARGAQRLDAHAARVRLGPLTRSRPAAVQAAATTVRAQAAVSDADLAAALPPGTGAAADPGRRRRARARGERGRARASAPAVRARLSARDGALVIAPDGLLGALGSLTLFADPRVQVTGVDARAGRAAASCSPPTAAWPLRATDRATRFARAVCAPASIARPARLGP